MVLQARGGRVPSLGRNECGARGYHVAGLTSGGRARLWAARAQIARFFWRGAQNTSGSPRNPSLPVKDLEITRGALVASGCSAQPGTRARSVRCALAASATTGQGPARAALRARGTCTAAICRGAAFALASSSAHNLLQALVWARLWYACVVVWPSLTSNCPRLRLKACSPKARPAAS